MAEKNETVYSINKEIDDAKKSLTDAKQSIGLYKKKIAFLVEKRKTISLEPPKEVKQRVAPKAKKVSKPAKSTKTVKSKKSAKSSGWKLPNTETLVNAYSVAQNAGLIDQIKNALSPPPPPVVYAEPAPVRRSIW
jgi:regulator of replication initiation timing